MLKNEFEMWLLIVIGFYQFDKFIIGCLNIFIHIMILTDL